MHMPLHYKVHYKVHVRNVCVLNHHLESSPAISKKLNQRVSLNSLSNVITGKTGPY